MNAPADREPTVPVGRNDTQQAREERIADICRRLDAKLQASFIARAPEDVRWLLACLVEVEAERDATRYERDSVYAVNAASANDRAAVLEAERDTLAEAGERLARATFGLLGAVEGPMYGKTVTATPTYVACMDEAESAAAAIRALAAGRAGTP